MAVSAKLEQRQASRHSAALSALVKVNEDKDAGWQETVEIINVSANGAGFYLEKKREVGQILLLLMPLPSELRRYHQQRKLYRVWGLVQHCYPAELDGQSVYYVGVAFTGKFAPPGYRDDPSQSYRICGMNENGFWTLTEVQKPFVARHARRVWCSIEVLVEFLDFSGNATLRETAKTENISADGAAVFSNLNLNVGSCIKFTSKEFGFSTLAIVRNCRREKSRHRRLHVEFVNGKFPVDKIKLPFAPTQDDSNAR